jgi:hypothetical protein
MTLFPLAREEGRALCRQVLAYQIIPTSDPPSRSRQIIEEVRKDCTMRDSR